MKTSKHWAAVVALAVPFTAFGQDVIPALDASAQPASLPEIRLVSPASVRLDPKEAHGARLADEWKNNQDKPRRGADGSVRYLFGATLPTLVCTPLQVCSIQLQPGEIVNDVHAGDTARWRITPATSGAGSGQTTHVIVKPTDAGLTTNLLVTTDRRTYTVKLVSTQETWIPVLSFDYPDDVQAAWAEYAQAQQREHVATTLPTGQNLANLDFGFRLSGDNPRWRPMRVYTDGEKTYIQFASASFSGEAPALIALGQRGTEQLVNYRIVGDSYVVDKVIDRAALISGVGRDQVKVNITRGGSR